MIYVVATLMVKPEKRADFLENARDVIGATRKEDGCISYDLTSSISVPNAFIFVERWETREALTAHFATPHLGLWRDLCVDFVEERTVEVITPEHVEML